MVWVEPSALQSGNIKRDDLMTKELSQDKLEWSIEQITLWIDNDRSNYDRKMAMFKSLEKKKDKGTYNPDKALKMFNYLTTDVRRKLNRESRDDVLYMIGTTMPPVASSMADIELRDEFGAWYNEEKEMRSS